MLQSQSRLLRLKFKSPLLRNNSTRISQLNQQERLFQNVVGLTRGKHISSNKFAPSSTACLSSLSQTETNNSKANGNAGLLSTMLLVGASLIYSSSSQNNSTQQEAVATPKDTSEPNDDDNTEKEEQNPENLPVYKLSDVALNNGQDGKPIWMTYGGMVYDVTEFIPNHPGGSEHILRAAGSSIEPYWNIYRQHFSTDLPMRIMEHLVIGTLDLNDQEKIDDMMEKNFDENDPYKDEPIRHLALKVHGDQPMNAEVPHELLTENYLTPQEVCCYFMSLCW